MSGCISNDNENRVSYELIMNKNVHIATMLEENQDRVYATLTAIIDNKDEYILHISDSYLTRMKDIAIQKQIKENPEILKKYFSGEYEITYELINDPNVSYFYFEIKTELGKAIFILKLQEFNDIEYLDRKIDRSNSVLKKMNSSLKTMDASLKQLGEKIVECNSQVAKLENHNRKLCHISYLMIVTIITCKLFTYFKKK